MRYLSIVTFPTEFYIDRKIMPEDIHKLIKLPDGVRKIDSHDNWYNRTFNILLESDSEVKGYTFPTLLGERPRDIGFIFNNVNRREITLVPYVEGHCLELEEDLGEIFADFFWKLVKYGKVVTKRIKSYFKRA